MTLPIFFVLAIIMLFVTAILFKSFRRFLGKQFEAIGLIIAKLFPSFVSFLRKAFKTTKKYVKKYISVLTILTLVSIVLMVIALLINSPVLTGLVFALCLALFWLVWLPAGLAMKLFKVTEETNPQWLKNLVATTAFIGFVGLTFPEFLSFGVLVGLALLGFIFSAATKKSNVIDKIIIPLTILMVGVVIWKYAAPEGFRSTTRYVVSWSKVFNTAKDRGSINNETEAATTYCISLKDISVLYEIDEEGTVTLVDGKISKGDTLRLASHREEVITVDGQGLLKIQLKNGKGTFIGGQKYWVEAEFVQIVSPREIVDRDSSKKSEPINTNPAPTPTVSQIFPNYTTLEQGTVVFEMKAGEETPWFTFYGSVKFFSPTYDYVVKVSDGTQYPGKDGDSLPPKKDCYFKLVAKSDQFITVRVGG